MIAKKPGFSCTLSNRSLAFLGLSASKSTANRPPSCTATSKLVTSSIAIVEQLPAFSVEAGLAHHLERLVVGWACVQRDPRQKPGKRDVMKVRRLMHDVLARKVVAALLEQIDQGLGISISGVKVDFR